MLFRLSSVMAQRGVAARRARGLARPEVARQTARLASTKGFGFPAPTGPGAWPEAEDLHRIPDLNASEAEKTETELQLLELLARTEEMNIRQDEDEIREILNDPEHYALWKKAMEDKVGQVERGGGPVRRTELSPEEVAELKAATRPGIRSPSDIPSLLYTRLEEALQGRKLEQLMNFHDKLTQRQRERGHAMSTTGEAAPIRYSWKESLAYAAFDMIPFYGILRRVYRDALSRVDEETRSNYKTMLDFGGGPGTAILAARDEKNLLPGLREGLIVDPSRSMWELAVKLNLGQVDYRNESVEDILQKFKEERESSFGLLWCPSLPKLVQGLESSQMPQYDIVNCSLSLSELSNAQAQLITFALLWRLVAPGGTLIITERGDVAIGQQTIQLVRSAFIDDKERLSRTMHRLIKVDPFKYGGKIIAPCTHHMACPLAHSDARHNRGCYFTQEAPRSITKRGTRGQGLGRKSSPFSFSYLAIQKDKRSRDAPVPEETDPHKFFGRIVRPPLKRQRHVTLDTCTSTGNIERFIVTRFRDDHVGTDFYRASRKSQWGGLWFNRDKKFFEDRLDRALDDNTDEMDGDIEADDDGDFDSDTEEDDPRDDLDFNEKLKKLFEERRRRGV